MYEDMPRKPLTSRRGHAPKNMNMMHACSSGSGNLTFLLCSLQSCYDKHSESDWAIMPETSSSNSHKDQTFKRDAGDHMFGGRCDGEVHLIRFRLSAACQSVTKKWQRLQIHCPLKSHAKWWFREYPPTFSNAKNRHGIH